MINNPTNFSTDETRPLSYADLRRFFGLVAALALGALLVWRLADVLMLFVIVALLAMILNPLVVALEKRGVGRGLAVALVVLSLLAIVALTVAVVVPPILQEVNGLVKEVPTYRERIQEQFATLTRQYPDIKKYLPDSEKIVETAQKQAGNAIPALQGILRLTGGVLGAVFGLIVSLLLLVFMLSNPQPLVAGFLGAVPPRHRDAAERSLTRLGGQMSAWAKATLINGLITGVSTGLLLHFAGIKPALVFGILAFFGEFVPNIGPLIAAVPALFVALGQGMDKFGIALVIILFVQQIESNVLVPFIMGKQMQLHPVTIVFFALGMGALFGVTGAILAVPVAALAKILIDEFYFKPQALARDEMAARAETIVKGEMPKDEVPKDDEAEASAA